MKIALGSDECTPLTDALQDRLGALGHEVVTVGALREGDDASWPSVGTSVGRLVAQGECESGIVCCWSGTGVSIAANKVPGVRAALCDGAQTASLARVWNDANVLALSLRTTSPDDIPQILEEWFGAQPTDDPVYGPMIAKIL